MNKENELDPNGDDTSGGCSTGCAWFFFLLVVVWPLLYMLGGSYNPEDIFSLPVLLGGPAFIVTHILAIIALFSKSAETRRRGKRSLWIVWGGIAIFLLLGLIGCVIDMIRGKV